VAFYVPLLEYPQFSKEELATLDSAFTRAIEQLERESNQLSDLISQCEEIEDQDEIAQLISEAGRENEETLEELQQVLERVEKVSTKVGASASKLEEVRSTTQIDKLRSQTLLFSEKLSSLIQTFEMLRPVAEDQELLRKYSGTKHAPGLSILRWSMIQECLIGIPKLALDRDERSLSARNLIAKLLAPEAKEGRAVLKKEFAVPIKRGSVPGEPTLENSRDWEEVWKEEEKREIEKLGIEFDQHLKQLCKGRAWFESNRKKFTDIRNKNLAHFETSKVGTDYVLTPVSGPDWSTLENAVNRLIELAELLLLVLHQKDGSFPQLRELAKRDAFNFWQNPPSHQPQGEP
jgi:AbiU2